MELTPEECAPKTQKSGREVKNKSPAQEQKSVKFELESSDEEGVFTGYAAVFGNRDSGDDIIERGAFAKTLVDDYDRIKILALHNNSLLPVGKPIELREDEKGLFIRGKISDTSMGKDIKTLLKDGVLTEMSIGYDAVIFDYDSEQDVRHLKEVKLWEISIVTWAMNDQAKIDEVKDLVEALREDTKAGTLQAIKESVKELADLLTAITPKQTEETKEQTKLPEMTIEIVSAK